ncbi:hypothetical protein OCU04_010910 [Sclerotinia nivalis]|uniref:N-acetyltransferase domain-containing protein n=1 Tax=Sclerotinia nivalis TaxID=352851 RepID=A0A9X0AD31_9HELO|nr:hypothetical protein OCU04_010910 [Sclerotinia nivalis]
MGLAIQLVSLTSPHLNDAYLTIRHTGNIIHQICSHTHRQVSSNLQQVSKIIMTSSESSKFFTENWTIAIPSHPNLRFIRLIPSRYDHLVRIFSNPLNEPHNPTPASANWKESDTFDLRKTYTQRYSSAKTAHNALALLVEEKGKIVGIGLMHELKYQPGLANIGTILEEGARGHGVGKVLMELLLRLSNELDVDAVEVATMKGNSAMRGLMRSLGIGETDEERIKPGNGNRKVEDVMFKDIDRKRWKDFEFEVEFLGEVDE